jgi:hypothetical protein
MYNEETIDFGNVEAASEAKFLDPGMYRLKVDAENTSVIAQDGKTPYLTVRFYSEKDGSVNEKFFLTAKALPRLQYLHEVWFNKKLDKKFTNFVQVGEYFKAALTSKIVTRPMVVGGKITPDGKFYSGLPYTGFVVLEEALFEEGPFDKDSDQYKRVVKVEKANPAVANTDSAMLPSAGNMPSTGAGSSPWD